MQLTASLLALAVAAAPAIASLPYKVLSDGSGTGYDGALPNLLWTDRSLSRGFDVNYHSTVFMTQGGCSSTAKIDKCFAIEIAADANKQRDGNPHLPEDWGVDSTPRASTNVQRGVIVLQPFNFSTPKVSQQTFRFHLSTAFTSLAPGTNVTLGMLQGYKTQPAYLAVVVQPAANGKPELAVVSRVGTSSKSVGVPLSSAVGKTLVQRWTIASGTTIPGTNQHGRLEVLEQATGKVLLAQNITATVAAPSGYRVQFGAFREARSGAQNFKGWYGDYSYKFL